MALESGSFIDSLNSQNPVATDGLAQADDHLRLIKATIKATFPNITGAVTVTHTDLNTVTTPAFPSGTRMLFQQTAAPTGWTKETSHNDKTLRVVSGTVTTGGSNAFTSAFSNITPSGTVSTSISGTVANHTLTIGQIPSHQHFMVNNRNVANRADSDPSTTNYLDFAAQHNPEGDEKYLLRFHSTVADRGLTSATGSGQAHNHGFSGSATSTFTGNAINLDVQYVDIIIAQKD